MLKFHQPFSSGPDNPTTSTIRKGGVWYAQQGSHAAGSMRRHNRVINASSKTTTNVPTNVHLRQRGTKGSARHTKKGCNTCIRIASLHLFFTTALYSLFTGGGYPADRPHRHNQPPTPPMNRLLPLSHNSLDKGIFGQNFLLSWHVTKVTLQSS